MDIKLKLSLLQCKNKLKIIFAAFILVFSILFCSATQISISPPSLDFAGKVNENICKNIILYANGVLEAEIRFSDRKSKNLNDYVFNSNYFGIIADYDNEIDVNGEKSVLICSVLEASSCPPFCSF